MTLGLAMLSMVGVKTSKLKPVLIRVIGTDDSVAKDQLVHVMSMTCGLKRKYKHHAKCWRFAKYT